MDNFTVKKIKNSETKDFILHKHYAQRMPKITWAFGLFDKDNLVGVCTIGKPSSPFLCSEICGEENGNRVWELSRLIVNDGLPKNVLSWFVSKVLKSLKEEDLIIVAFSDDGVGHKGYIYQATNWLYTGKTKERTDRYMPDNKHPRHYTDEFLHIRKFRTSKHRYVYFTGRSRKIFKNKLKYNILPYPKGDNTNYVLGIKHKDRLINIITGKIFYE